MSAPDERYARELAKKAARARRKLDHEAARQFEPPTPPQTTRNHGLGAWWQLVPKWPVALPVCLIGVTFELPIRFHSVRWAPVLWSWVAVATGVVVLAVLSMVRFVGFLRRIPFQISGWERLVSGNVVTDRDNWRSLTMDVFTGGGDSLVDQAVASALTVFAARANRRFYEAMGIDDRTRWTATGTRATGSANARVIWDVYRLLDGELSRISTRVGRISRVQFDVSSTYENVSEEID